MYEDNGRTAREGLKGSREAGRQEKAWREGWGMEEGGAGKGEMKEGRHVEESMA